MDPEFNAIVLTQVGKPFHTFTNTGFILFLHYRNEEGPRHPVGITPQGGKLCAGQEYAGQQHGFPFIQFPYKFKRTLRKMGSLAGQQYLFHVHGFMHTKVTCLAAGLNDRWQAEK